MKNENSKSIRTYWKYLAVNNFELFFELINEKIILSDHLRHKSLQLNYFPKNLIVTKQTYLVSIQQIMHSEILIVRNRIQIK